MAKKKKTTSESPSGIVLYAKRSGLTSFSSLWSIKNALHTDKVGHTGTLDSFADGLLVVLSGRLTHLVPHITGFSKTYLAVVAFGSETDTLDPTGNVVKRGRPVAREEVEQACGVFTGALLQVPPVFSAVHVNGSRASNVARNGGEVSLPERQIFIYSNKLLDFRPAGGDENMSWALLEISCSKGTYIRALARDMAASLGTVAHLSALRRTVVGPFSLDNAAGVVSLPDFTIDYAVNFEKQISAMEEHKRTADTLEHLADIRDHFLSFTPTLARTCGFKTEYVNKQFESSFLNGRSLAEKMFSPIAMPPSGLREKNDTEIAVFYDDNTFAGMLRKEKSKLAYGFVVPKVKRTALRVFSWEQIAGGEFPVEWKSQGTALSVGGFDGVHHGHQALLEAVREKASLVPGVVTFKESFKAEEEGTVMPLDERLAIFFEMGMAFAVVIDFSSDISRMEGNAFFSVLLQHCGVKFLAEGRDFRCGYKGSFTMDCIKSYAAEQGFEVATLEDVRLDGERVSSSRIREAVRKGEFLSASRMLSRPFSYSLRGLSWTRDLSGMYRAETVGTQVLPRDGMYDVVVKLKDGDGGYSRFDTRMVIEEKRLSVFMDTSVEAERMDSVTFITRP